MSKNASVLRQARALLTPRGSWCQAESVKDKHGIPVDSTDPRAAKYCALGALPKHLAPPLALREAALLLGGTRFPHEFNDAPGRTHDEVLWMFDLAIAMEETP